MRLISRCVSNRRWLEAKGSLPALPPIMMVFCRQNMSEVRRAMINSLARSKDQNISVTDYISPNQDVNLLISLGKMLTRDKLLFTKFCINNDSIFGIVLDLKMVISIDISVWVTFQELTFEKKTVVDFQTLSYDT